MLESDLEKALAAQIEKFLLELGRGFMFVGTQQRITLNNTHYYVDMVFYNKILRAYVLIELKTTKPTSEAAGQLNMYLNYYAAEVNDEHDNLSIGIILCTDKDSITAEYALGGLSNTIFSSRYVSYIPNKEQLSAEIGTVKRPVPGGRLRPRLCKAYDSSPAIRLKVSPAILYTVQSFIGSAPRDR